MSPEPSAELRGTVTRIANAALKADNPEALFREAAAHDLVRSQLRADFEVALVDLARKHNATHAFQRNVPNEVWCLIWAQLGMGERIPVARVCHSWRTLALDTPRLWRDIDFHCQSPSTCDCKRRSCDGHDNLAQVVLCLSRSGMQPLSLSADICGVPALYNMVAALRDAVQPYSARLVTLRLRTDDEEARSVFFLEILESLSALRTLHIHCGENWQYSFIDPGWLQQMPRHLPMLQELDMYGSNKLPLQPLPSLVTLRCQYEDTARLGNYIRNAPALKHLCLRMPTYRPEAEVGDVDLTGSARVRRQASPGLCVDAVNLCPRSEAIVLAIFGTVERAELRLDYTTLDPTYPWDPVFSGLDILQHISRPEELSLLLSTSETNCDRLTVSLCGDGKTRTLVLPWASESGVDDAVFPEIYECLATPPRAIVVDERLWPLLDLSQTVAIHLRTLTLHLTPARMLFPPTVPNSVEVPSLEKLVVEGHAFSAPPSSSLSVSSLQAFLQSLQPVEIVSRLVVVLSAVELSGDIEELDKLCKPISYT